MLGKLFVESIENMDHSRLATVLGVVSAGGLGTPLIFATREWNWSTLSSILIAIIIMVVVVYLISSRLRTKLV